MKALLILLSLSGSAGLIAKGQRAPSDPVDPAIWQVESAGVWEDGGKKGHYRAATVQKVLS